MRFIVRLTAFAACAALGTGIALTVDWPGADENVSPSLAFHTSSRLSPVQTDIPADEMAALRSQIWALTEQGGTIHCSEAGVTAPCVDTTAANLAN